jgi:hypothetical protein
MLEKEAQVNFYYHLGKLATSFATLEDALRYLLVMVINSEDPFPILYVIERNSFSQNLDLLRNLSRFKAVDPRTQIEKLILEIEPVRSLRNSFIHGVWEEAHKAGKEIVFELSEFKMKYEIDKDGESWMNAKRSAYTLQDIKNKTYLIEQLIRRTQQISVVVDPNAGKRNDSPIF